MAEQQYPSPMPPLPGNPPLRVLVISFHFPPMNAISSFRAEGFARYLPHHGMEVTVLTSIRDPASGRSIWHPGGTPTVTDRWEQCTVHRVPRIRSLHYRFVQASLKVPLWSTVVAMGHCVAGTFDLHMIDVHRGYKRFLKRHLKTCTYDVVLCTAPPDEHIALGAWVNERYGIPFIADFRDLYDTRPLMAPKHSSCREQAIHGLKHFHHRRWARHTTLHTCISGPLLDALGKMLPGIPGIEIRNGYHPAKIDTDQGAIRRDRFCITYAGRIYPWQEVSTFTQAFRSFMDLLRPDERALVDLRMFGCQDSAQIDRIKHELRGYPLHIQADRIPETDNYRRIAESSVLLVFDIAQVGGYTGKLMDYLGCHRNVLLTPSDNGVMQALVEDSGIGVATSDPASAAAGLLQWFLEWRTNGHPQFNGNARVIAQGSREAQTAKLAETISTLARPTDRANAV